jgi:hypothetical protein
LLPSGFPCGGHAQCESGTCSDVGFCAADCSFNGAADCSAFSILQVCVYTAPIAGESEWFTCAPYCESNADCVAFPEASCQAVTVAEGLPAAACL